MRIETGRLKFSMRSHGDIADCTAEIAAEVRSSGMREGNATLFVVGSTGAITTVEFEPGLVETDLPALFDELAPYDRNYAHNQTWEDDNGASHVRASLLGSSLTVPFVNGELTLGTWQQIIVINFDTSARSRELVVQLIGQ